jgi:hypothetical protein
MKVSGYMYFGVSKSIPLFFSIKNLVAIEKSSKFGKMPKNTIFQTKMIGNSMMPWKYGSTFLLATYGI